MRGAPISACLFFAGFMMLLNLFIPLPRLGGPGMIEPPKGEHVVLHVMFVVGSFVLGAVCWYYVDRTPRRPIVLDPRAGEKLELRSPFEKPVSMPPTEELKAEPPVREPALQIVECPNCQMRVVPMESGICPSCRQSLVTGGG